MFYGPFYWDVFKAAPSVVCGTAGGVGMLLLK